MPDRNARKPLWKRVMYVLVLAGVGFSVLLTVLFLLFQDRFIYVGGRYEEGFLDALPPGMEVLEYETKGRQYAYYLPPATQSAAPEHVYVFFGGNATLALFLSDLAQEIVSREETAACLLVEYPGYGANEGKPGPRAIERNAAKAQQTLEGQLQLGEGELDSRISVFGHSMGCAAALSYLRRVKARNAVLIAPFTSLKDMARGVVGWPLCLLLREDWDNRASLDAIAAQPHRPRITILHGGRDETIPHKMGKELAESHPDFVDFISVPKAGHGDILDLARQQVFECLMGVPE